MASVEGGSVAGAEWGVPSQPTTGSGGASWAPPVGSGVEPRPKTFWSILKATERSLILYLYDKIWGGQLALACLYSKFWRTCPPSPPWSTPMIAVYSNLCTGHRYRLRPSVSPTAFFSCGQPQFTATANHRTLSLAADNAQTLGRPDRRRSICDSLCVVLTMPYSPSVAT